MLYADKRALETNLKVNLLAIREKELNYYAQNCLAVGTQAALLAGFAYSGLTQVAIPLDSDYVLKLLYLITTTTAMCLELIAVMSTTLLAMMGPGLALRGPDGSMHPAVDGMMDEYKQAYLNFFLGLIAFHLSAAIFGWLTFSCARADTASFHDVFLSRSLVFVACARRGRLVLHDAHRHVLALSAAALCDARERALPPARW